MVPPFDHEWIIEGQGTCGLEILEQVPRRQHRRRAGRRRRTRVGRGRGRQAVARPDVRVVGVEPAGAAKMTASLAAGHPVTLDSTRSIADGLMPVRPGDITFEHVKAFVDAMVTVDDALIARAALWLFHEAKQVVEPSGAATVAAVLWPAEAVRWPIKSATVVAILSGGNVAPRRSRSWPSRSCNARLAAHAIMTRSEDMKAALACTQRDIPKPSCLHPSRECGMPRDSLPVMDCSAVALAAPCRIVERSWP